mmetsp:Transcript_16999/g.30225  ORF Transcript_16999/g.30225 Transcript_16999/m.30225 type:complete len:231 (-) Transcript_16999:742-1434(-)
MAAAFSNSTMAFRLASSRSRACCFAVVIESTRLAPRTTVTPMPCSWRTRSHHVLYSLARVHSLSKSTSSQTALEGGFFEIWRESGVSHCSVSTVLVLVNDIVSSLSRPKDCFRSRGGVVHRDCAGDATGDGNRDPVGEEKTDGGSLRVMKDSAEIPRTKLVSKLMSKVSKMVSTFMSEEFLRRGCFSLAAAGAGKRASAWVPFKSPKFAWRSNLVRRVPVGEPASRWPQT